MADANKRAQLLEDIAVFRRSLIADESSGIGPSAINERFELLKNTVTTIADYILLESNEVAKP
jgi:hypothetical protein